MPSLAYMQGMSEGLERQAQIKRLQMEERQQKEQLKALAEKTKGLRMEAGLMGIPKEIAESLSTGELEAAMRTQKEMQAQKVREEERQAAYRDTRAMAAASQEWDTLAPSAKQFFVSRTGAEPTMAKQIWDSIGLGGRARAFGIQHQKTLEQADQRDREMALEIAKQTGETKRQQVKLDVEAPVRQAEIDQKRALTEQAAAQTTEAKARTEKTNLESQEKEQQVARYRMDLERFGGKAEYDTVQGKLMYRSPGEKDWKPVGLSLDEIMMASQGGGAAAAVPAPVVEERAPVQPAKPVKITTDQEYKALPSGTVYIAPDGKKRRKP